MVKRLSVKDKLSITMENVAGVPETYPAEPLPAHTSVFRRIAVTVVAHARHKLCVIVVWEIIVETEQQRTSNS